MAQNKFIVFIDKRFLASGLAELKEMFGKISEDKVATDRFHIMKINRAPNGAVEAVYKERPVFIDDLIPLIGVVDFKDGDYSKVIKFLTKELHKEKSFKLEVMNAESVSSENAKTIEVKIGSALEGKGFRVDLKNPERYMYVVLNKNKAYVGKLHKDTAIDFVLDHFREENNKSKKPISRAWYKLDEAIRFFRIDISRVDHALDIGAAPGGWTAYLVKAGARTVAIDGAEMDYKNLKKVGTVAVAKNDAELGRLDMVNTDIIHLKHNVNEVKKETFRKFGPFDGLFIDMNSPPADVAKIARKCADFLNKGAVLVLTVKIFGGNVEKHMKEVKSILSPKYGQIAFKKLAYNRMELTLFGRKK